MLDLKGNKITYFGHSTFGLTTPSGQFALIDPWVNDQSRNARNLSRSSPGWMPSFLRTRTRDHIGDLLALGETVQTQDRGEL